MLRRGPTSVSALTAGVELVFGALLLAVAAAGGFLLATRHGLNRVDRDGYFYVPAHAGTDLARELVKLGSGPALVLGVIVVLAVAATRDRVRAVACSVAPVASVLVVEHVAKPMVGRTIALHEFSYPSGTVAVIASLAAAFFLVAPSVFRPVVAVLGALAVAAVGISVVVLRWHYPTDVVGGVCVGAGFVFFVDGLLHLVWRAWRGRSGRWRGAGANPAGAPEGASSQLTVGSRPDPGRLVASSR